MKKFVSLAIALLILGGLNTAFISENGLGGTSEAQPSPLFTHSPIRIDSNADFDNAHGVLSGSGTVSDPYIFDNWTIDGSGAGYGIYIGNTTAYFIIRNCTVQNANGVGSEPYYPDSNIVLYNVTHGMITNVTSTNAANNGIYLLGWSHGNTIYNNTVDNNVYGIVAYGANNSFISDNTVTSNSQGGIRIDTGYFNTVQKNTATNNGNDGLILVQNCHNTTIKDNALSSNTGSGMEIDQSHNSTIVNNTMESNGMYGILIQHSDNTYLEKERVTNRNDALHLSNTKNTEIYGSTFDGMGTYNYVIFSQYDENLTMKNISAGNSTLYVIYLEHGKNILIDNSKISNDTRYHGIMARYSENLSISNSSIWNIYQHGIDIMAVRNYTVENNRFSGCHLVSIYTGYNYDTKTRITNNTITGSYVGILVGAQNSVVRDNTMFNTGIFMTSWDADTRMYNNTVNGKPVFYAYGTDNLVVPPGMGEIILNQCDYFTIEEQNLSDGTVGVQIYQSHHGMIRNNTVLNNHMYGIWIWLSNYCEIYGNTISNSSEYDTGISSTMGSALYMGYTRYDNIHDNEISNSRVGVYIDYMSNSNTFQNNTLNNDGFFVYYLNTYSLDNDISPSNTVNGLPVYYLYNQNGTSVPPNSAGQVIIADSTNISVGAQSIHDSTVGMEIIWSSDISAGEVHIQRESRFGVVSVHSSRISVENSSIGNLSVYAIMGYYSDNLTVRGCAFADVSTSYYTIDISYSPDAIIDNCTFSNVYRGINARYSIYRAKISGNNINVTNGDGIYVASNLNTNSHVLIEKNHIYKTGGRSYEGILLYALNGTEVRGNTVTGFYHGAYLSSCYDADVHSNDFVNNTYGVYISRYSGYNPYIPSKIYHNNFIRNLAYPAHSPYNDSFNLTYPGGGNYYAYEYSFYNGVDYFSGPNQDMPGSDGFGDTPYIVTTGGSIDHYPLIFPYGSTPTYLANSSWPMLGHDMKHTGSTDVNGPTTNTPYWTFSTSDSVKTSASLGPDGTIYVGSMDHRLYALNPDGTQKWNFTTVHNITSTPAIAQDGTIYFGSGIYLYALYPNGTEKWRYNVGDVKSSPVIGTDGTIYVGSDGGVFTAINDDGTRGWFYDTGSVSPLTSPAIGTDGTIYFSNSTNVTYALSPSDGVLKWTWTHPGAANVSTPPLVLWNGTDDTIIIGFDDGNVSAIASDGTYLGGHTLDGKILGIASRGNEIYITTANGTLYAVDYDTGPQWTFKASAELTGSPAVDGSGNIYLASTDGGVYALDSSGSLIWNYTASSNLTSPPSLTDGLLFVGSTSGLVCMGDVIPPTVSITSPSDGAIILSENVTVTWTGGDSESGLDHYETRMDGGNWTPVGTNTQHTFSGLSDGVHTVDVMAVDAAGNTATDSVNFTVDTYPPVINITNPVDGTIINTADITIAWEGSDNGSGIDHYELSIDGGAWTNMGENTSYELTDLSDGNHTVEVRAWDIAGRNSTALCTFTVDTSAPEIHIDSPSDGEVLSESTVTISWTGSDALGMDHYEISIDGGTWENLGMNTSYEMTGLSDGAHTVSIRARDKAGNDNTTSVTFITDTASPEIEITSPTSGSLQGSTVTVSWQGSDSGSGVAYYLVRLDGDMWMNTGMNTSWTFENLEDGNHTIDVRATDNAGLLNLTSVSFKVDATAPSVISMTPHDNEVGVSISANITIVFSEPIDISNFEFSCSPNPGEWVMYWSRNNTMLVLTHDDFSYGMEYVMRFNATDMVGNRMHTYVLPFTTTDMGTITGKVLDENGNPISGATVTLDTGESTTTDENGSFSMQVHAGNHTITISKDGYETRTMSVDVNPGETAPVPSIELPESKSSAGTPITYVLAIILLAAIAGAALFLLKRRRSGGSAEGSEYIQGSEEAPIEEEMEHGAGEERSDSVEEPRESDAENFDGM